MTFFFKKSEVTNISAFSSPRATIWSAILC